MQTKEEILSEKLRVHGYNLHNILHTKGMMNDMLTIAVDAMEEYHTQFSLLEKTETVTTDHSQLTQPTVTAISYSDYSNVQRGTASEADFENNTWTFQMDSGYKVRAGRFVIIQEDKYEELITSLKDKSYVISKLFEERDTLNSQTKNNP